MSSRARPDAPEATAQNPLQRLSYALLLCAVCFLLGWWSILNAWITVSYEVDHANSIACVLLLVLAGMVLMWQAQQHQREYQLQANQRWLALLMVRREQIEACAQRLEDMQDALSQMLQTLFSNPPRGDMPAMSELERVSPTLQPWVMSLTAVSEELVSIKERLVNLHVKFSQGVALDALAYDLTHLTQSFLHLEDNLQTQLAGLSTAESLRLAQWQHLLQAPAQDHLAPFRELVRDLQTSVHETRGLLSQGLGQAAPETTPSLDQFLGINR